MDTNMFSLIPLPTFQATTTFSCQNFTSALQSDLNSDPFGTFLSSDQTLNETIGRYDKDERLEKSLSNVLTHVYPAAERYDKDECSILCLDQGVSYTNAKNVDQNNFMVSPIVTIQVTKFECGGLALSFSVSHPAIDDFTSNREENIVVKRFVVHEAALSRLRKQCIDESGETKMELHNFIILIRNTVNKVVDLCAKASPDEIVSTLANIYNESVRSPEWGGNDEVDKVTCSSWRKLPLQDIDFGLGKPSLVYFGLKDMEIFWLYDTDCHTEVGM
ncbi:hypothetical protein H5410_064256 [Solanum commersonii]|uniref:Anthocyanin acyltransferase n=1 Tax=Solanum commersonii TaxID=4109 RepID=A0A9J5W056_SOLCO|nr:hypothetical protein H5410_064256 [Solanum commersonii]